MTSAFAGVKVPKGKQYYDEVYGTKYMANPAIQPNEFVANAMRASTSEFLLDMERKTLAAENPKGELAKYFNAVAGAGDPGKGIAALLMTSTGVGGNNVQSLLRDLLPGISQEELNQKTAMYVLGASKLFQNMIAGSHELAAGRQVWHSIGGTGDGFGIAGAPRPAGYSGGVRKSKSRSRSRRSR